MPVTPTYPGVYIQELTSPVHTITGVATSIAAFVGSAEVFVGWSGGQEQFIQHHLVPPTVPAWSTPSLVGHPRCRRQGLVPGRRPGMIASSFPEATPCAPSCSA